MVIDFRVFRRNIGHWDIVGDNSRLFRIRGGPGNYWVADERQTDPKKRKSYEFKTMSLAMAFICEELMFELIIAEGQEPQKIEAWNVLD